MANDWQEVLNATKEAFLNLGKGNPELTRTAMSLGSSGNKGALDHKTRELISLAVAATTRCEGCIAIHAEQAAKIGATRQEILETLAVAVGMNTGAAIVYSGKILQAYDQMIEQK